MIDVNFIECYRDIVVARKKRCVVAGKGGDWSKQTRAPHPQFLDAATRCHMISGDQKVLLCYRSNSKSARKGVGANRLGRLTPGAKIPQNSKLDSTRSPPQYSRWWWWWHQKRWPWLYPSNTPLVASRWAQPSYSENEHCTFENHSLVHCTLENHLCWWTAHCPQPFPLNHHLYRRKARHFFSQKYYKNSQKIQQKSFL